MQDEKVTYTWEKWGNRDRNPWWQGLHWVRQDAATRGLIGRGEHGIWTLTERGAVKRRRPASPGTRMFSKSS